MWDGRGSWGGWARGWPTNCAVKKSCVHPTKLGGGALLRLGKWDKCITYWHINVFREADAFCICILHRAFQGPSFLIKSMARQTANAPGGMQAVSGDPWVCCRAVEKPHIRSFKWSYAKMQPSSSSLNTPAWGGVGTCLAQLHLLPCSWHWLVPQCKAAPVPCGQAQTSSQPCSSAVWVPVATECPHVWDSGEHMAHSCEEEARNLDFLLESSIVLVHCPPPLTSVLRNWVADCP